MDEVLESEYSATVSNEMDFNIRLFVGADVPIVDRLSLNFELGIFNSFGYSNIQGFLNGVLRYNFGK